MADNTSRNRLGYISADGVLVPSGESLLSVENPATGETIAEAHQVTADELDRIITQAQVVYYSTWRHETPEVRGRMLAAWADAALCIPVEQVRDASQVLGDLTILSGSDSCKHRVASAGRSSQVGG